MNTTVSPTSHETPARGKILVVDDDDAVRRGLRCVLVAEGYEGVMARNGVEAVAAFRSQPCELALIDMNMPLRNGWGAIASLRTLATGLPIIIITARPDQRTMAREAGVELMEKPLDLPLLLRRISELLGPPRNPAQVPPDEHAAA